MTEGAAMAFFNSIVGAGIVVAGFKKIIRKIDENNAETARKLQEELMKSEEERKKRMNTVCNFDRGISKDEFYEMVMHARKGIKRLTELYADDTMVYGKFLSQSGINEWYFTIDFNDYGELTGSYWLTTNNENSHLPDVVGQRIAKQIENHPSMIDEYPDDDSLYEEIHKNSCESSCDTKEKASETE